MKKWVSFILVLTLLFQIIQVPAFAVKNSKENQSAPVKVAALPLVIIPIGVAVKALIDATLITTAIVLTVVAAKDVAAELTKKQKGNKPKLIIYRTGSGGNINLTPRLDEMVNGKPKDWDGLSYTIHQPVNESYTAIDCDAINKTAALSCKRDPKPGKQWHYLIRAKTDKAHMQWINSRKNAEQSPHQYTKILQNMSVRVK